MGALLELIFGAIVFVLGCWEVYVFIVLAQHIGAWPF